MYFALDITDPRHLEGGAAAPKFLWEYSVFKNTVATFDLDAAAPDFMASCVNNQTVPNPGAMTSCQAPTISARLLQQPE